MHAERPGRRFFLAGRLESITVDVIMCLTVPTLLSRTAMLAFAVLCIFTPSLLGVQVLYQPHNYLSADKFFCIKVANTPWEFYGRVDRVLSVSFQEYSTGALMVSEVSIDMEGSNQLLRIYSTRPVSVAEAERAANAAANATTEVVGITPPVPSTDTLAPVKEAGARSEKAYAEATAGIVIKTYPATTHAKTVEFTVKKREELISFYKAFLDRSLGKKGLPPPSALNGAIFIIN